jgi:hypothetical protein
MLISLLLAAASPAPLVAVPFGSASGQLGLIREPESSPEAPGSLAVDDAGRVFVLDAVKSRVAVFEQGKLTASIALPSDTVEDIALLPSGDVVALDRLVQRTVYVVAPNGAVIGSAAIEGEHVPDGGEVTAVLADASGVWVEVYRGEQVRLLDREGRIVSRATRPGVPTNRGDFVRMRKIGDGAQILFYGSDGVVHQDGATTFANLLELSGLVVNGDKIFVAGHEMVERKGVVSRDQEVVVELQRLSDRLVEVNRHVVKASPDWVPLKQLVAAGAGVAHLYVDSTRTRGVAVEVTSW